MSEKYFVSDVKDLFDIEMIHGYLSQCYWSKGIPLATLSQAIKNSICFGVYDQSQQQVGFARLITDQATFAYLADVFILPDFQGNGLSKMLMGYIKQHPSCQGLRRMVLATADAHSLYQQYEFKPLNHPESFMEIWQPNIYQ